MKNSKFRTVITGNNYVNSGDIIYLTGPYGTVRHATPLKEQDIYIGTTNVTFRESTDVELLKAWLHSTKEKKHGVHATREALKEELESRGFELNESGLRWFKKESIQPEVTE